MRRLKSKTIRNKLDLSDRAQVRLVKKRLRLSESELSAIVTRVGNSISAISKQAALQRTNRIAEPSRVPTAGDIASVATNPV
jgi:hypothetical protein